MNNNYRFHIRNYHAIADANIDISGITILAGENGCGKSTLAHWLYYIVNGIHCFEQYQKQTLHDFIQHKVMVMSKFLPDRGVALGGDMYEITKWCKDYNVNVDSGKELAEHLLEDSKAIIHSMVDSDKSDKSRERILQSMSDDALDFSIGYSQVVDDIFASYHQRLEAITDNVEQVISNQNLSDLQELIAGVYELEDTMPESLKLYENGDLIIHDGKFSHLYMLDKVIYIDSPMVLSDNVAPTSKLWSIFIQLLRTKPKKMDETQTMLYNRICNIINGKVRRSQKIGGYDEFHYERTDGLDIRLADTATGIKTFAYILQLLVNGHLDSRTILVIDEPEAHLHPQWIVELSRILLLINKVAGVKIIIASHNPDMVAAMKSIGEAEDMQKDINFYIAHGGDNGMYWYENLGCEIDKIFESFNIALDRIDEYACTANANNNNDSQA